jgi:hypothetical protein
MNTNLTQEFIINLSRGTTREIPRNGYDMIMQGDYSTLVHNYGMSVIVAVIAGYLFSRFVRYITNEYYTAIEAENYQIKIMKELPGVIPEDIYKK